ncbi:ankyrin [Daldinia loculata]|uniref:ankyrin n=1 Tax=Daldinia loculata TaxID=103429 RepID=UPI0020C5B301|nr:ankyrin [Daldinia loculata]KAI1643293.1 ankyrin [Daldinia loculata]
MRRAKSQAEPQVGLHTDLIITNTGISNELLTAMPMEIMLEISKYMSQATKVCLAQTCRGLSTVMDVALYDQDSKEDRHALWWACMSNQHKLLRRIINYDSSLVNYHFRKVHAIKSVHSIPKHLMKVCAKHRGADFSIHLTPLTVAIRFGSFNIFTTLLKLGANVNAAVPSNGMGSGKLWLPIHWVVRLTKSGKDFEDCVSLLIKHGANINQAPLLPGIIGQCGDGVPLLEVIDFQPYFGQNRSEPPDALYETQIKTRISKAKALLRFGADPNFRDPSSLETPIFKAARSLASYDPESPFAKQIALRHDVQRVYEEVVVVNALQLFKALIDHGGNPNISCDRTTALHLLCKRSREYIHLIYYLLQAGACINATDANGRTPIYQYVMFPRSHIFLTEFIEHGANVNHRDFKGRTPLHVACADYNACHSYLQDTIKTLLENGADPTLVDNEGNTPLALLDARRIRTWVETRKILLKAELKASGADSEELEDEQYKEDDADWLIYNDLEESHDLMWRDYW